MNGPPIKIHGNVLQRAITIDGSDCNMKHGDLKPIEDFTGSFWNGGKQIGVFRFKPFIFSC